MKDLQPQKKTKKDTGRKKVLQPSWHISKIGEKLANIFAPLYEERSMRLSETIPVPKMRMVQASDPIEDQDEKFSQHQ